MAAECAGGRCGRLGCRCAGRVSQERRHQAWGTAHGRTAHRGTGRAVPASLPGRDPPGGRCALRSRAKRPCQATAPLSPAAAPPSPRGVRVRGPPRTAGEGQARSSRSGRGRAIQRGEASAREGLRMLCRIPAQAAGSRAYLPPSGSQSHSPPRRAPRPPQPAPSRAGLWNVLDYRCLWQFRASCCFERLHTLGSELRSRKISHSRRPR